MRAWSLHDLYKRYSEARDLISLETCTATANVCETDTQTEGSITLFTNDSTNDALMEVHNDLDTVADFASSVKMSIVLVHESSTLLKRNPRHLFLLFHNNNQSSAEAI